MSPARSRECPAGRPGWLTIWDLDAHDFRAVITIQGSRMPTVVAPRRSLFFCGARLSDFHGLLVNIDPREDLFRIWDVDAGLAAGFGTRFLDQGDGLIWVTNFTRALKSVVPLLNVQVTWALGFVPAGLASLNDGTVLLLSGGTPSGQVHRFSPLSGQLTTWTLPEEQAPFDGVATPGGRYYFAKRRPAGGIARFDPSRNVLLEWQLPSGSNPQVISRDRLGRIWFSDANFNNRIGRLDPRRSTVAFFIKNGVVTFSVRPVDPERLGRMVAGTDLTSSLDLLCETGVPETPVRVCRTVLTPTVGNLPSPVLSAIPPSSLVIPPTMQRVHPVEPPDLFRYSTPVVAPIDLVEHLGAVYATAGVFNERAGPSRLFRLRVPGLRWVGAPCPTGRRTVGRAGTGDAAAPPPAPEYSVDPPAPDVRPQSVIGRQRW